MNKIHIILVWLICWVFAVSMQGCLQRKPAQVGIGNAPKTVSDFNTGWLHGNCLAIKNDRLTGGDTFKVIALNERQTFFEGRVIEKTMASSACPALLPDRQDVNLADGYTCYTIAVPKQKPLELGIALVGFNPTLHEDRGIVYGDINGDHHDNYFTQCNTSEGIQFNIWSDNAFKGSPIWTGYYYLGYDTKSNCP
jgi:hypothetical protein